MRMRGLSGRLGVFLAVIMSGGGLLGDHHKGHEANATGVWKWTMQGRNNESRESTIVLIQDGGKLMGTVSGRSGETKISDGKVDGNKVSFTSARETQRGTMKIKYSGTVKGAVLDGVLVATFGDREFEREFQAKRQPAKAAGSWDWVLTRDNGEEMTATLRLSESEGKLSGTLSADNFDLELDKLSLKGSVLSFETVFEGNGQSMTISHQAAVLGDKIMGRASGERDGESFTREWKATR